MDDLGSDLDAISAAVGLIDTTGRGYLLFRYSVQESINSKSVGQVTLVPFL